MCREREDKRQRGDCRGERVITFCTGEVALAAADVFTVQYPGNVSMVAIVRPGPTQSAPVGQGLHRISPWVSEKYVPPGQTHDVSSNTVVPAGHVLHSVLPSTLEYFPDWQMEQAGALLAENRPVQNRQRCG